LKGIFLPRLAGSRSAQSVKIVVNGLTDSVSLVHFPWISGSEITSLVSISDAISAIENALLKGHDPARDPARTTVATAHGQLLLMSAESQDAVGVKVAGVAPGNPALGLPRIQGIYLLMDRSTLRPVALLDGPALTLLRTPAVSGVAAKYLARPNAENLVVFGSGPQVRNHIAAMCAVRSIRNVTIVARSMTNIEPLLRYSETLGLLARSLRADESQHVEDVVEKADLIVCATTSSTPLFRGSAVRDGTCVLAIGSHEPRVREVDGALVGRSYVFVEDQATALRESGDVIMAIEEGFLEATSLISIRELVSAHTTFAHEAKPSLFKSSGMAWQDLAVAEQVLLRKNAPDNRELRND
jgi:ornithine cyclodeaminase/alanine dehydrogenase-like protein (mu-crystallin family)